MYWKNRRNTYNSWKWHNTHAKFCYQNAYYTDCTCLCMHTVIGACRWLFNNNRQVVAVATTRATATENRARKICMHEKWSTHNATNRGTHTQTHTKAQPKYYSHLIDETEKNKTTTKTVWFLYGLFAFAINENTQVCLYAAIHVRHSLSIWLPVSFA